MSVAERFSLDGNVAVVTGAGGGIGTAAAVALAEAGADLALVGRNVAKLEETAQAIAPTGRAALVVEADVTDEAAVATARDRVIARIRPRRHSIQQCRHHARRSSWSTCRSTSGAASPMSI